MLLKGKVALITGAGQGIGQGIAFALAKEGALVAITGRTYSKLEATCQKIADLGGTSVPIECDVKDLSDIQRCVDQVVEQWGTLNILVNNAQEVPLGDLHSISDDAFTAGFESGPLATLRFMKAAYPHLKGDGNIINLASTSAKRWDMSGFGAYAAVKEAIRSLSQAAASEWGGEGIRTNIIMPHAKSPALAQWVENFPEESAAFINTIPMKRIGECEDDIGRFVAMLCSDYSSYVNGQSIAIDGGQAYMG